jgi:hypothetical protein
LKQAAAQLHDARLALAGIDDLTSATIDILLRRVLAQIRRLEQLYPGDAGETPI